MQPGSRSIQLCVLRTPEPHSTLAGRDPEQIQELISSEICSTYCCLLVICLLEAVIAGVLEALSFG